MPSNNQHVLNSSELTSKKSRKLPKLWSVESLASSIGAIKVTAISAIEIKVSPTFLYSNVSLKTTRVHVFTCMADYTAKTATKSDNDSEVVKSLIL